MEFDDICIICLESISTIDAIWSCTTCYCEYHLVCINDWISQYRNSKQRSLVEEQDSMNLSEGYASALNRVNQLINAVGHWSCPKCRNEYTNDEAPNRYYCYCGKVTDPKMNHWQQAHSCGEQCGKFLKPYCGDVCLELCHRGPCPPCPKMLTNVTCYCGKQNKSAIRCSQRYWSCGNICGKQSTCGIHFCEEICHGNCESCQWIVDKPCSCGEQIKAVKCSDNDWQCSKNCKKIDESLLNKCCCGKISLDVLNSGDGYKQMTCKDTCNKFLECGIHRCTDKCHLGDCSGCRQMVNKSCRCGATSTMTFCNKKLTCNTKCIRWKNCNKHQCKRRCCDPTLGCAPCELICNNTLSCRKHRCQLRCHSGPCYPCQKFVEVSCSCGDNVKKVACGVKTEKIRELLENTCKKNCQISSKCRHANLHKCHSKNIECPSCKQVCDTKFSCGHHCPKICHDSVKTTVRLDKSKLAGPWEAMEDGKIKFVTQPCPPCVFPLSIICFGGHQLIFYECYRPLKFASCGRECGRLLTCGNHYCSLECHQTSEQKCPTQLLGESVKVINANPFCEETCNRLCTKPNQKNSCEHPCSKLICHKGSCPPCTRYVSYKCYCGALDLHIECHLGPNPPSEMLSCPSRCNRMLTKSCGHQCPKNCHPGNCEDFNVQCKTKVILKCPCGQKKLSIPCWKTKNYDSKCDPNKCDNLGVDSSGDRKGNLINDHEIKHDELSSDNWKRFLYHLKFGIFIPIFILIIAVLIYKFI